MPKYAVGHYPQPEKVFVNGNEVKHVVSADTDKGEVVFYPWPPRIHKKRRNEVYQRKLRGHVTVAF